MLTKNTLPAILTLSVLAGLISFNTLAKDTSVIKEGATLVTLVNLHPYMKKKQLQSLNYQMPDRLIPMCSKVTIEDIGKKEIEFTYDGVEYSYIWDKHTRKAGESLMDNFAIFVGEKCDSKKVATLSPLDRAGIESGVPKVGMSKEGILFAMGRPPIHATSSLDSRTWMYWLNRWKRQAIEFDENGIVTQVRL